MSFSLSGGVGELLSWTGTSAYTSGIGQLVNSPNGMTAEVSSGSSSFKTEAENPNYPGSTYVPISANSQLQAEMYIDSEVISLLTTLTPTATTSWVS